MLKYERREGESWLQYEERRLAELGSIRGSPAAEALFDYLESQIYEQRRKEDRAETAEELWFARKVRKELERSMSKIEDQLLKHDQIRAARAARESGEGDAQYAAQKKKRAQALLRLRR